MTQHTARIFAIVPGSTKPSCRQRVELVRRQVAGGQLAPGDTMPSVRDIAQALAINPMTVPKACGLPEMDGMLLRSRHQGMAGAASPAQANSAWRRQCPSAVPCTACWPATSSRSLSAAGWGCPCLAVPSLPSAMAMARPRSGWPLQPCP
ncbi:MAG: GntR family transcriptional regulator [Pseudomonadota bacterium]|nr:GntR family transcriptional regulator [Pseudomonadota bacterium]